MGEVEGVVEMYNVVCAFARRTSHIITYPVAACFPLVPALALFHFFLHVELYPNDWGRYVTFDVPALAGAVLYILFSATRIHSRSIIVPLIVGQLNFGKEIDFE